MLLKLSRMPRGKKSGSIKMRVAICIVATLIFIPHSSSANDLASVQKDVEAYLEAVHGARSLKSFHYFEGEAGDLELELELQACSSLNMDTNSDRCIAYTRCRWENRGQVSSYFFTALSQVLPKGKVEKVWVGKGDVGTLPHIMVHAKIGKHTLSFFRPTQEDAFVPFGRLSLVSIDGERFDPSGLNDFNSMLYQDLCAHHILANSPSPFVISCGDVEHVIVELVDEFGESERIVVGCQVELTHEAGVRLDEYCVNWFGYMFPITADGRQIIMYDSTTRSIPPQFFFMEETWEDTKAKLMAICPDKIPEIPQRVLDHRPE